MIHNCIANSAHARTNPGMIKTILNYLQKTLFVLSVYYLFGLIALISESI